MRMQAGYAGVFDVSTKEGEAACSAHSASIIKCIAPILKESKNLDLDAKKVINQDLSFRKYCEESIREIAAYHRLPLTELENKRRMEKDKQEEMIAQCVAREKFLDDWMDAINSNELFDLRKEYEERLKKELYAQKKIEEQLKFDEYAAKKADEIRLQMRAEEEAQCAIKNHEEAGNELTALNAPESNQMMRAIVVPTREQMTKVIAYHFATDYKTALRWLYDDFSDLPF